MTVFGNYSRYYDLLYKDKDYLSEAEYVDRLIKKYAPTAKTVLNLGCGTGKHDFLLAEKGYEVAGVDMSEDMLAIANAQLTTLNLQSAIQFTQGDIRTIRLSRTFDVIISLFHVMSYQPTNADLRAVFATVKAHLNEGGIFIFDCWYGPAVLADRPVIRVKRLEDEAISVVRIAEPVMHPNDNLVDVHYQVLIGDKETRQLDELKETHRMRYLFKPEIETFMSENGLTILENTAWMSEREPGFDTWSICFVGRI